jgi:hypothetical protein
VGPSWAITKDITPTKKIVLIHVHFFFLNIYFYLIPKTFTCFKLLPITPIYTIFMMGAKNNNMKFLNAFK